MDSLQDRREPNTTGYPPTMAYFEHNFSVHVGRFRNNHDAEAPFGNQTSSRGCNGAGLIRKCSIRSTLSMQLKKLLMSVNMRFTGRQSKSRCSDRFWPKAACQIVEINAVWMTASGESGHSDIDLYLLATELINHVYD